MITERNPNLDDRYVLWDVNTVMEVLDIKRTSVYAAIKDSGLPKPIKVGGLSKWRKSEILDWLDSRPQGLEHEIH